MHRKTNDALKTSSEWPYEHFQHQHGVNLSFVTHACPGQRPALRRTPLLAMPRNAWRQGQSAGTSTVGPYPPPAPRASHFLVPMAYFGSNCRPCDTVLALSIFLVQLWGFLLLILISSFAPPRSHPRFTIISYSSFFLLFPAGTVFSLGRLGGRTAKFLQPVEQKLNISHNGNPTFPYLGMSIACATTPRPPFESASSMGIQTIPHSFPTCGDLDGHISPPANLRPANGG